MQSADDNFTNNICYMYTAGCVHGGVSINLESAPNTADPRRRDRVFILFRLFKMNHPVGAPPDVVLSHHRNMSVVRDVWTNDLRSFLEPERTAAWHALCARFHSAAPLPADLRNELVQILLDSAKHSARLAVTNGHRRMSMLMTIFATVDVPCIFLASPFVAGGYVDAVEQARAHAEAAAPVPVQYFIHEVPVGWYQVPVAAGIVVGLMLQEINWNLMLFCYDGGEAAQTCSICLEDMTRGSMAGWLQCGHMFHPTCIARWLSVNGTCPVCRMEINRPSSTFLRMRYT